MDTLIIETRSLGARPTAIMGADLDLDELKTWLGRAFSEVARQLEATDNPPAGPPFARYHCISEGRFHVEAGFPVFYEFASSDGVRGSNLPGGEVAITTHMGPYEGLGSTYEAIGRWLESRGATPAGDPWEVYFNGPEDPPSKWRTDVYQPYRPL